MEESMQQVYAEDEINLGPYWAILRRQWWKIVLLSLAVGVITLIVMFRIPNTYKATAVIAPVGDEGVPASFSYLTSLGIPGRPGKAEDLEVLFKSDDLSVRVVRKYNLWPILFPEGFDPQTGKFKAGRKSLIGNPQEARAPGDWDAIHTVKGGLAVSVNRRSGTLSLSFESRSAEGAAQIVRYFLDEAKSRLQEEAFDRAVRNKKFIQEQIGRTIDALTRDRLYFLYGQEVEREMMARNREQFGFRVIDSPRVPDSKSRPQRLRNVITMMVLSFVIGYIYFMYRGGKKGNT